MSWPRKVLPPNNYIWRIEHEISRDKTAVNKLCVQSMYQYIHQYSCKSHLDGFSLLSSDNHIISYLIPYSKQKCSTKQLNLNEALRTNIIMPHSQNLYFGREWIFLECMMLSDLWDNSTCKMHILSYTKGGIP